MECVTRGFREIKSKSTIDGSISSFQKNFTVAGDNTTEHNQNIAPIFGKEDLIERYLESVSLQNKELTLLRRHKTLLRRDHETLVDSVKLLSGGATMADPLYSGSIGPGMLTGAVFGEYKKSPPSLTILEVLRTMSRKNKQGILVIVLNNLANRLNFGSACQSADSEGIKTLLINVGEDVSGVSVSKAIGRKGLCGIKFLFKIAGALSQDKKTIQEIYLVIEKLKGNCLGSINVQIRSDMMVIGPGCKGESEKLFFLWNTFDDIGETARLSFIVRQALSHLFHPSSYFSLHVVKGDKIVIIVNNLGTLSDLYLSLITKEIVDQTMKLGFIVMRLYSGRFLNSNLPGFSISVLKIKNDNILKLLDRPVKVTSWIEKSSPVAGEPNVILSASTPYIGTPLLDKKAGGPKFTKQEAAYLLDVLPNVVETIQNMEEYLNKLDNDHDFGTAITKFASAIQTEINKRSLKISSPYEFLDQMAYLSGFTMGGVAGGIFTILFSSAAQVFLVAPPMGSVDLSMWVDAARSARDALQRFTRVRPGDGTILDALDPFVEYSTEHSVRGLSKRVSAAVSGAERTSRTSRGSIRTSSSPLVEVNAEENVVETVSARAPDPGALCLAAVIRTIFTSLQIELAEAEAQAQTGTIDTVRRLKDSAQRQGTKMKDEETKHVTILKETRLKKDTTLEKEESKHVTKLEEKASENVTILEKEVSKDITEMEENESKHVTKLDSNDITELAEEESKNVTKLEKEELKDSTEQEGNESKHGTKLKTNISKDVTELEEKESPRGAKLEEMESKHGTKLEEKGSKYGMKLEEKDSKHVTKLENHESKISVSVKVKESKHETHKDESLKLIEAMSLHSHSTHLSQSIKEKRSEEFHQLQEAFEDIAKEIENEIPDDTD